MIGLIGKKVGMTQVFDDVGKLTAVTVIEVKPNVVLQTKTKEKNGYSSVLLGSGEKKERLVSKPEAGQFAEGIKPVAFMREFRNFSKEVAVGDTIGLELLEKERYIDVTAFSKGKGFQGVMKRHGYHGGPSAHGSKFHRVAGSTGQCTSPGRSFKNTTMPGRTGFERVTVQNLKIVKIDAELGVVMVSGAVPGRKNATVYIKSAVKKQK
ncbi:MAG: 50S ribosomal protein L3 [Spirochaetaceae bacterium]|nr:50S ribosomal protein L3 [Spirochaetaceae bacterium]